MRASLLRPGSVVIAYIQSPRERFWGVVRSLDAVGLVIQGIDLDSFDDWVRQVAEGGHGVSLSTVFFPLLRVEKLLLDEDCDTAPSLCRRFERRVGRTVLEFMDSEEDAEPFA